MDLVAVEGDEKSSLHSADDSYQQCQGRRYR